MLTWILGRHFPSFFIRKCLAPLVCLAMHLNVIECTVWLPIFLSVSQLITRMLFSREFVCVTRISIRVTVRVGRPSVREKVHYLVRRFLVGWQVIPEHRCILQIGLRIALLSVNKDGEFARIPKKEDRRIVVHPVPISWNLLLKVIRLKGGQFTFFCVKLDRETSRVPCTVCRPLLSANGWESCNTFGLFANFTEHGNRSLAHRSQQEPLWILTALQAAEQERPRSTVLILSWKG